MGSRAPTNGWPRDVFGGRVPIINFSGGTEVGGSFLAPYPVEVIRSCSLGAPSLGMDVDVVDAEGNSVRGEVGRTGLPAAVAVDDPRGLERRGPLPRGLLDDLPGSVAPRRLRARRGRPVVHPRPLRRRDECRGQAPGSRRRSSRYSSPTPRSPRPRRSACPTRPRARRSGRSGCRARAWTRMSLPSFATLSRSQLGKPFAPSLVRRVAQLPKTRSQKIMRRAVRAAALGIGAGGPVRRGESGCCGRHPPRGRRNRAEVAAPFRSAAQPRLGHVDLLAVSLEYFFGVGVHVPLHPTHGRVGILCHESRR